MARDWENYDAANKTATFDPAGVGQDVVVNGKPYKYSTYNMGLASGVPYTGPGVYAGNPNAEQDPGQQTVQLKGYLYDPAEYTNFAMSTSGDKGDIVNRIAGSGLPIKVGGTVLMGTGLTDMLNPFTNPEMFGTNVLSGSGSMPLGGIGGTGTDVLGGPTATGALPGTVEAANTVGAAGGDALGSLLQSNAANWGIDVSGLTGTPALLPPLTGPAQGATQAPVDPTTGNPMGTTIEGAAPAATTASALTALSKLTGLPEDTLKLLGLAGATGLGMYTANNQTQALTDLANQFKTMGAPSLGRYEASMTPGFDISSIPGLSSTMDTAANTTARALSTKGNPAENPGLTAEMNKYLIGSVGLPALQEYQRTNLAGSGLANMNAAYPQLATGAINTQGNVLTNLAGGLSSIVNPVQTTSLQDLMKFISGGKILP